MFQAEPQRTEAEFLFPRQKSVKSAENLAKIFITSFEPVRVLFLTTVSARASMLQWRVMMPSASFATATFKQKNRSLQRIRHLLHLSKSVPAVGRAKCDRAVFPQQIYLLWQVACCKYDQNQSLGCWLHRDSQYMFRR